MAKNLLLRWSRMFVDGYDLSGDSRTIGGMNKSGGEVDVSGWSEAVHNFIKDYVIAAGIEGYQAILNDTALSGAHTILKDGGSHDVAFVWGAGAAPVVGDLAYVLKALQLGDEASISDRLGVFQADFKPLGGYDFAPMGVMLSPDASIAITTTFASVDNGVDLAATSRGWLMQLHILEQTTGNFAFTIEDSADGAAWLALASAAFTIDGSAVESETIISSTKTAVVRRYIRLVATRTAGSVTPVCVFSRN